MSIPYHTHAFELPIATELDMQEQVSDKKIVTPSNLGTAALANREDFASAEQGKLVENAVVKTTKILTGSGLVGGGDLSKSRTLGLSEGIQNKLQNAVPKVRKILASEGLTGGGDLSNDISISLAKETKDNLFKAQNSLQKNEVKALAYKDKIQVADIANFNQAVRGTYLSGDGYWHSPGMIQPFAVGGCPYIPEGLIAHDWLELTPQNNIIAQANVRIANPTAFYIRGSCEVLDLSGRAFDGDMNKQDICVWNNITKQWAFKVDSHVGIMLDNRPTRCTREISIFLNAGDYTFFYLMLFTTPTNKGRRPSIIRKRRNDNFLDNAVPQMAVYKFWDT